MDPEADRASPRLRAASPDLIAARTRPLEETDLLARKRQRTSRRGSHVDSASDDSAAETADGVPAQTAELPARTSSQVTIHRRTSSRPPSASPGPSPQETSVMADPPTASDASTVRDDLVVVDLHSDATWAMSSPSPLAPSSPPVEVVMPDHDEIDDGLSPAIAIIDVPDDFDQGRALLNLRTFPNTRGSSDPTEALKRLAQYFQNEAIENAEMFEALGDWMAEYLTATQYSHEVWLATFLDRRDFWWELPRLIYALSFRTKYFGQFLHQDEASRGAITNFFGQFCRLAGRLVVLDVQTLEMHKGSVEAQANPLASPPFLTAVNHIIRKSSSPHIGNNLEQYYNFNWNEDVAIFTECLRQEMGSPKQLAALCWYLCSMMSCAPRRLLEELAEAYRLGVYLLDEMRTVPSGASLATAEVTTLSYEMFTAGSKCLKNAIDQHVTQLVPEVARSILESLTSFYHRALRGEEVLIDHSPAKELETLTTGLSRTACTKLHVYVWKLTMLESLIKSAQMPLRIVGVTILSTDLVDLYASLKAFDHPQHALLARVAQALVQHKLIDYLVGAGAHPEIISESAHILGFLLVSACYTDQQTDMIWQAIATSQDPRVVQAILQMVADCLKHYSMDGLLYVCQKLLHDPLEDFLTPRMRDFCSALFSALKTKQNQDRASYLEAAPYELCVRLIRESSDDKTPGHLDLQNFAASEFRDFLNFGPSPGVRNNIYLKCIDSVSKRYPTAPGSICVIDTLLCHNMAIDIHALTTEHGLARLIIEELELYNQTDAQVETYASQSPAQKARQDLISAIIIHEPEALDATLGERLWDNLVGPKARSAQDRGEAWQILNRAVTLASVGNSFLATCFNDYLPRLPPACFLPGTLDFAVVAIQAWLSSAPDLATHDLIEASPAIAQLWRLILEAPTSTIDAAAIEFLVNIYLYSDFIASSSAAEVRKIHLALASRCLNELGSAADELGQGTDDTQRARSSPARDGAHVARQEQILARCLAVLREFMKTGRPKMGPPVPAISTSLQRLAAVEGSPITIKYQSFDDGAQSDVQELLIGARNSVAALITNLQHATGFDHCKVFFRGRTFPPDMADLTQALEHVNLHGLFLVKRHTAEEAMAENNEQPNLLGEIMKQVPRLCQYLSMRDKVAFEMYSFLVKLPSNPALVVSLEDDVVAHDSIFPPAKPYQCLYAVHTLREVIRQRARVGTMNGHIYHRFARLVIDVTCDRPITAIESLEEHEIELSIQLNDGIVQCLKGTNPDEAVSSCLSERLLHRLLQLIQVHAPTFDTPKSVQLAAASFEALLECCVYNEQFWLMFHRHPDAGRILGMLLLDTPTHVLRRVIAKQINSRCTYRDTGFEDVGSKMTLQMWEVILELIYATVSKATQCEEIYDLALSLLKKIAQHNTTALEIDLLIKKWGLLLLSYDHQEQPGKTDTTDQFVHGLSSLIAHAVDLAETAAIPFSSPYAVFPNVDATNAEFYRTLGMQIFRQMLFPACRMFGPLDACPPGRVPVLAGPSRRNLSEIIIALANSDDAQYRMLVRELCEVVPYQIGQVESATGGTPYSLKLSYGFDRHKWLRSATGYVGLVNFGSTCYINSLLAQLFMNVDFRSFILNTPVEVSKSQALLEQTQSVFANMQNSYQRHIEPQAFIEAIQTYDSMPIDVNIQMDADEFYNLLFDRWENQMHGEAAKREFKSFYGGDAITQIKSRECEHISSRGEVFSAIQCDIKGKSTLEESLQAYVEGEVMEGDNKYKCETCDRHVDAVKRTCLKTIPDNLILHLKRFAYSVRTGMRSKINDYFGFPHRIDMRPYTLEALEPSDGSTGEDMFELVGVLVHAGTAESGHYYSYIRERPTAASKEAWLQFNDDTVSYWDPKLMQDATFGGVDFRGDNDVQYDKNYSAYMLFYQRATVVAAQKATVVENGTPSPVKAVMPAEITEWIDDENQVLMRRHVLYDPYHPTFIRRVFCDGDLAVRGSCSGDHELQDLKIVMALRHLDQVVSRARDLPGFTDFMVMLNAACATCLQCCTATLDFFCEHPESLKSLLLRVSEAQARTDVANFVLSCLRKIKNGRRETDTNGDHYPAEEDIAHTYGHMFPKFLRVVDFLWESFHLHCRAWPEYFRFLDGIARMGPAEVKRFLILDYLDRMLDLVMVDKNLDPNPQMLRLANILDKRTPNRPVSWDQAIAFMATLLSACDLNTKPAHSSASRKVLANMDGSAGCPLTDAEIYKIQQHWVRGERQILTEKLLGYNANESATHTILRLLLQSGWSEIDVHIQKAILYGIKRTVTPSPYTTIGRPYLQAALVYCRYSEEENGLLTMFTETARMAGRTEGVEAEDFCDFFERMLGGFEHSMQMSQAQIRMLWRNSVGCFAPALLLNEDEATRERARDRLEGLILSHGPDPVADDAKDLTEDEVEGVVPAAQDLAIEILRTLRERYIQRAQQVLRFHLGPALDILALCEPFFADPEDEKTQSFVDLQKKVMLSLPKVMVEEVEEGGSDWDGSEAEYGSSDGIVEVGNPLDDELQLS